MWQQHTRSLDRYNCAITVEYIVYGLIYIMLCEPATTVDVVVVVAVADAYIRHIDADADLQKCVLV